VLKLIGVLFMLRFNPSDKRAFTIIELLIVIAIIAIALSFGLLHYRRQLAFREFQTNFDKMVQQIKEAQAKAKAYGSLPSGYQGDEDPHTGETRDYRVFIVNNGLGRNITYEEYNDVRLDFNFLIRPMNQQRMEEEFKGVCIAFGYNETGGDPDEYNFDNTLIFGPDGIPIMPSDGTVQAPSNIDLGGGKIIKDEFAIRMAIEDSSGNTIRDQWVFINSDTGLIRTDEAEVAEPTPTATITPSPTPTPSPTASP